MATPSMPTPQELAHAREIAAILNNVTYGPKNWTVNAQGQLEALLVNTKGEVSTSQANNLRELEKDRNLPQGQRHYPTLEQQMFGGAPVSLDPNKPNTITLDPGKMTTEAAGLYRHSQAITQNGLVNILPNAEQDAVKDIYRTKQYFPALPAASQPSQSGKPPAPSAPSSGTPHVPTPQELGHAGEIAAALNSAKYGPKNWTVNAQGQLEATLKDTHQTESFAAIEAERKLPENQRQHPALAREMFGGAPVQSVSGQPGKITLDPQKMSPGAVSLYLAGQNATAYGLVQSLDKAEQDVKQFPELNRIFFGGSPPATPAPTAAAPVRAPVVTPPVVVAPHPGKPPALSDDAADAARAAGARVTTPPAVQPTGITPGAVAGAARSGPAVTGPTPR